jgi:pSer/pThr/pTyr-binding forkhead associated (FHA) protein
MTLQARIVLNLIAGAVGGVLAWVLIDLTDWFSFILNNSVVIAVGSAGFRLQTKLGGIVGCMVSLMLGLVDALGVDSYEQRVRGLMLHGGIGFLGGGIGIYFGQIAYAFLAPHEVNVAITSPFVFVQSLIARSIGWALIGAGVGISQGIARRSKQLIVQGLFGGLAGGCVGGVLFQSAASVIGVPAVARLLGFVSIGACTGFFIGLVQTLFKQAWIKVMVGRNEGKEYLITKPVTVIGRSELADIGLFGNAKIMPHHCAIEQIQGRFRVRVVSQEDAAKKNTVAGDTKLNGLVVNPDAWLTDGDTIAVDDRLLQFRERLTHKRSEQPAPAPVAAVAPLAPAIPAALAGAVLRIVEGADVGRTFQVANSPVQIGRNEDCGVRIERDTLISRRHATLQNSDGQWSITDAGSANGTFVNNMRLEPSSTLKIRSGDHIRVGDTVLVLEL